MKNRILQWLWPTGSIFLAIFLVSGLLALFLQQHLIQGFSTSYAQMQTQNSSQQADRISEMLAQEIRSGADPEVVRKRFQESLVRNPHDDAGFLCLLDQEDTVICHPRQEALGMRVNFHSEPEEQQRLLWDSTEVQAEWLLQQPFGGTTQLVVRRPVEGTD